MQILATELNAASGKLSSMSELAGQALKRAKTVYDEALGLYAEVNTTLLPDIKLSKLRQDSMEMNRTVRMKLFYYRAIITNLSNSVFKLIVELKNII